MSICQQELEENFIHDIETDNVDGLRKYIDNVFHINSILRSRHKIWETNHLSILAIACYAGSVNIVRYLIERNVDVNQIDSLKSRAALHWAVASKNIDTVLMLIEAGAKINVVDRYSITPLMLCANNGDVNILRCLIRNGANVNLTDRMNLSALDHACLRLNTESIKELIMNGCRCGSSTPYSFHSPLKSLIQNKEFELAKLLIESGGLDLTNEKWLIDSLKNGTYENNVFFKWVNNYLKTPSTLLHISRIRIRGLLVNTSNLEPKVTSLKIPKLLKDYILMKH